MHARKNHHLSINSPSTSALPPSGLLTPRTPRSARGDPLRDPLLLSRSPPPSPGLPPLGSKNPRRSPSSYSRLLRKLLVVFCGVVFLGWLGVRHWWYSHRAPNGVTYQTADGSEYEMVGGSLLPDEPSVVGMTDLKGRTRWSISIPVDSEFPLRPGQYQELCSQAKEIAMTIHGKGSHHKGYYYVDPHYIDVGDAMEQGLLPNPKGNAKMVSAVGWDDALMGRGNTYEGKKMEVCETSMTFVMETSDAGMGKTLMAMWMAYGLARMEGRSFFVDDTRWPYGNYTSYFQPPPTPSCLPPMTSQVVPCPHQAKHLMVSAATIRTTFGHAFVEEYEDPRKMQVQRQHKIFGMLRDGYEALFRLHDDDANYVLERTRSLYEPVIEKGGINIGMHVRRGDRHPFEYQYSKDYIPLDRFMQGVQYYIAEHYGPSLPGNTTDDDKVARDAHDGPIKALKTPAAAAIQQDQPDLLALTSSQAILASDDPDVYTAPEMVGVVRAQDRIVLASKKTLEASGAKNKNRYIDEISGWEGGFYRDVFWSLGRSKTNNAGNGDKNVEPGEQALKMRELVGRAYLLDLAVLAKADQVMCTLSATGCRILAVMMGWEQAIEQGSWRNVDGEWSWRGIDW
ncbi:hypothetical protein GTA08_BOTSDO12506 [Botryosphaeria dothidea]|uniref:Uncharacterized protein n=1 Tax=Botryosphaeria dothidea TaxID=55169 RepID=A0A8H4IY97_9PEZI|nr:hypothetical protein GTA08_BOTSDO02802 [Botryosphaeria dothidea]KAF4311983.1 hypothetical protein GTA08_BOTSDO12506 [Botryosphaeria dothidea]